MSTTAPLGWLLLLAGMCSCRAHPSWVVTDLPTPGDTFDWALQTSDNQFVWIQVGDTLDVVLVGTLCRRVVPDSHGMGGCWIDSTATANPEWRVGNARVVSLTPLASPRYMAERASAGVRLAALRPGRTYLEAKLPAGKVSEWVDVVPVVDHLAMEPQDTVVTAGDVIRTRITARDASDRIVAVLRWPSSWGQITQRESADGFTGIVFPAARSETLLNARLGPHLATMKLSFRPKPAP